MKVYIYINIEVIEAGEFGNSIADASSCLVRAEEKGGSFEVHHPVNGYSLWPAEQFHSTHRLLTRQETQLINLSTAELQLMAISDGQPPGG